MNNHRFFGPLLIKRLSRNVILDGMISPVLYSFRWFGIELDEPLGRHDGTVEAVRYFAAPDDHGVFVTEARLTKLHNQPPKPGKTISDEHDSQTFSMNYHTLEDSLEAVTVTSEVSGKSLTANMYSKIFINIFVILVWIIM